MDGLLLYQHDLFVGFDLLAEFFHRAVGPQQNLRVRRSRKNIGTPKKTTDFLAKMEWLSKIRTCCPTSSCDVEGIWQHNMDILTKNYRDMIQENVRIT